MHDDVIEKTFEDRVLSGEFSVAYDPISKRWIKIIKAIRRKHQIRVIGYRIIDGTKSEYGLYELIKYT